MTTLAASPSSASRGGAGPVIEPPARFRDLLSAEWIKMWSLRSTPWTLALIALFVIGTAAMAATANYHNFPHYSLETQREHMFSLSDAFPKPGYYTLMIVAAAMGAITIVSEYGSGLIRTTTVAVPARGAVILAKAVVLAAVWTVAGAIMATGSFGIAQAILSGRDAAISITDTGAFRAWLAAALLAPVCALIGLGLGVLIRHSATTMVTSFFTLLVLPTFFSMHKRWSAELAHLMVGVSWDRLVVNWVPPPSSGYHAATIPGSWLVLAAWPVLMLALSLLAIRHRDV